MKHLHNYKLFLEGYEEIMSAMADDVDVSKIEGAEKEIGTLRDSIETKKEELEKQLENLENLQVDTFTDENKETVELKKVDINESIEKLKDEILSFEESITTLKDKVASLKSE